MSAAGAGAVGSSGRIVLLGGTSEIGLAIVAELARGVPREVALLGRDAAGVQNAAEGLRAQGCTRVITGALDAVETGTHRSELERVVDELGGADIVIVAVGMLGERDGLEDVTGAVEVLRVNMLGAGSLLLGAAALLRRSGGGRIVVLSSVAAERPRPANFVYGASKAGLDALARGLGDALHGDGVQVLVVRPGFVRTRMTAGMQPAPFACDPRDVAVATVKGLDRGAQVVWVPSIVRWPMLLIRLLPRQIFRRIRQ